MNLSETTQISYAIKNTSQLNSKLRDDSELSCELVLEDADGHPTFRADPEMKKVILSFLAAL